MTTERTKMTAKRTKTNCVGALLRRGCMAALLSAVAWIGMGCEGGGGDNSGGSGDAGSFTGSWALYAGTVVQGSPAWYVHFKSDSSFFISDGQDGSGRRVSGTYSVSGGKLTGPFTNPGTGEGRVEATIVDNVMYLKFIEYWHTPNKVVQYAGTRL
jgi:hypothetical protein